MARAIVLAVALVPAFVPACFRDAPPAPAPAASAKPTVKRPAKLAGHYIETHDVPMVCDSTQTQDSDGWCHEEADDTMTIRERDKDRIDVVIELVRTNAHTCSFEGTLERDGLGRRWRYEAETEEFPCTLLLEQESDKVTVSSEGCREFCGVRASLDATFAFPPKLRTPPPKSPDEE